MIFPRSKRLARRLLLVIGLATFLPLVLLVGTVLYLAYGTITAQTYATIQETSKRYAADFRAHLNEKLGLMKALAATSLDPDVVRQLLETDPDLKEVWVRTETKKDESAEHTALYEAVKARQTEVLSGPDFARNEASLGMPLIRKGTFTGMVAVSFSLQYFQEVVTGVHLFSTGYALLVSHEGYRMAHPDPNFIGVRIGNDVSEAMASDMLGKVSAGQEFWFEKNALLTGKWSRQYYSPVTVGRAWNPWFFVVVVPADEATQQLNTLFLVLVAGSLAMLVLVAASTWLTTRSVVLPIRSLARGAESIAEGNFDTRVQWSSDDEVGQLAAAFNRMTEHVVQTIRNQEAVVRERTADLTASLAGLETAQGKIIASEKLAVLGQLTATIAHEVNTPLGAIRSSASFLHQAAVQRAVELPLFFRGLSEDELAQYQLLVSQKDVTLLTSAGDERKRRRALAARLEEAGIEHPEVLAEDIVFLVTSDQDDALVSAAAQKHNLIRFAAQTAAITRSTSIILEAADRAAATVSALVNYSRIQEVHVDAFIDPAQEIETLLTLYYGLSKHGVVVTTRFEPGVKIWGDRDRLNQVWVNLINNALQAMNYRGNLVLEVRSTPENIEVVVANDGPPIPPPLQQKIFEPFFTTKKAGEGTGLGLDICRRIIAAHQGSLTVQTEGRFTVFIAHLPHHPERSLP